MELYELLEKEWANFLGINAGDMVACSNGTAALHLALEVMRYNARPECRGGSIIIPDFTMIACARACTMAGYDVEPVDCGKDLLMNPAIVASMIDDTTKGIMAVHIYGRSCNMDWIADIALENNLFLIEDMAELQGVKPHPMTDAACWSFYKNKVVCGEEGGAVWFNNPDKGSRNCSNHARELRCQGFTARHDFLHTPRGHNYRLADCLANLVRKSISETPDNILKRWEISGWYDKYCPMQWVTSSWSGSELSTRLSPWVYDIRIPDMDYETQNKMIQVLNTAGIPARHGFKPITMQDEYKRGFRRKSTEAWKASREVIYLPLTPGGVTSEAEAKGIFEHLTEIWDSRSNKS